MTILFVRSRIRIFTISINRFVLSSRRKKISVFIRDETKDPHRLRKKVELGSVGALRVFVPLKASAECKCVCEGSEVVHIPPQDLQQLRHPVEVLRLINKTADRREEETKDRRQKWDRGRNKGSTSATKWGTSGSMLPSAEPTTSEIQNLKQDPAAVLTCRFNLVIVSFSLVPAKDGIIVYLVLKNKLQDVLTCNKLKKKVNILHKTKVSRRLCHKK